MAVVDVETNASCIDSIIAGESLIAATMAAAILQSATSKIDDEEMRTKMSEGAGDELRRKLSRWAVEANEKTARGRCDSDAGVLMKEGTQLEVGYLASADCDLSVMVVEDGDNDENYRSLVVEDNLKDVPAYLGNEAYGVGSMLADFSDFDGYWRKSEGKQDLDLHVECGSWGLYGHSLEQKMRFGVSGSWETNGWSLSFEKSSKSTLVWAKQDGEERTWRRIGLGECRIAETNTKVVRQPEGKESRMRWLFCVPRRTGVEN